MKVLTSYDVECIQRIGRDEEARSSTLALVVLDDLCGSHEALRAEVERLRGTLRLIAKSHVGRDGILWTLLREREPWMFERRTVMLEEKTPGYLITWEDEQ